MPSQEQIYEKDEFTVWFPDAISVLTKGDGSTIDDRRIGGYASTESLDRQGEIVLQKGLDFTEFVQHGYFNDNHRQDTAAVVGVPELARFDVGRGWYTEGYLLKGVPKAEEIWRLANALHGTGRKLGFSIEGKVLERREGNKIAKARVRHVAVTNSPVNTDCTWGVLTKSFCLHAGEPSCTGKCCDLGKALSIGHSLAPTSGGGVLVPESLEGAQGKHTHKCPKCKKVLASERAYDGHMATKHGEKAMKSIAGDGAIRRPATEYTREEAVKLVARIHPEWPPQACERIVGLVIRGGVQ